MPGLDPRVAMHRLNINADVKPVKQQQRRFRPEVMEAIQSEVKKLIYSGFIREEQHPDWVANIVPIAKKNGKIQICIDFHDLNEACSKDEFPLPITDVMIDNTMGSNGCLSWTDSRDTIKLKCTLQMRSINLLGPHWGILLYCHAFRIEECGGDISEGHECHFPRTHAQNSGMLC